MRNYLISQNTFQQWGLAVGTLIAVLVGMVALKRLLMRQFIEMSRRTPNIWDDLAVELVEKTEWLVLLVVSVYGSSLTLTLHQTAAALLQKLALLALLLQIAIWGTHILTFWSTRYKDQQVRINSSALTTILRMGFILRVLLWTVLALIALDTLGANITTLIAGLGITGIAVALAVQNILKDLLSALSIVLDKPFEVGDFIIVDSYMGAIERIGLKTTRVRSISGELLIFSNSDLLQSRIRNYKHMYERRVVFSLGISYDTPLEKVAALPAMLRAIVASKDQVRFDRAHFSKYAASALEFEIVYWMQDPDYTLYMDTQQAINLEILYRFEREGIRLAYPTQTLQVQMLDPQAAAAPAKSSVSEEFCASARPSIGIRVKRISEPPAPDDGTRILVDGYWPPGVSKEQAAIDVWLKEVAASGKLRQWFAHDPEKWVEFQARYAAELDQKPDSVARILALAKSGTVTLVFGSHNIRLNAAIALGKYLRKRLKSQGGSV